MSALWIKEGYRSELNTLETQKAVKKLKDFFQTKLAETLCLTRVSAPLFVLPETGLNDDLSGVERPVTFGIREQNDRECQIVHSLAKWKRFALQEYGFSAGTGLYTDMNAIRRDEETDNVHSLYVDQWDWERVIEKKDRCEAFLKEIVTKIYTVFQKTEEYINTEYSCFSQKLPAQLSFITSQELLDLYPNLTAKERETAYLREKKAAFILKIGGPLSDGSIHDGRAPDYDDWALNGDLLFYHPVLDAAFELSSMGIRVDETSLVRQLEAAGCKERLQMPFHQAVLNGELPYTIGGGIGQSRLCMFFLEKLHIGEVHVSVWRQEDVKRLKEAGVTLL